MTKKNQWQHERGHVFTPEEKADALRDLVFEAAFEQSARPPRLYKSAHAGPAFEMTGFQTDHVDALATAIRDTTALFVLNDLLNPGRIS